MARLQLQLGRHLDWVPLYPNNFDTNTFAKPQVMYFEIKVDSMDLRNYGIFLV